MDSKNLVISWEVFLKKIKAQIPVISYRTWFEPIIPLDYKNNTLTIQVPSPFFYKYLEEEYLEIIRENLFDVFNREIRLEYSVIMENDIYKKPEKKIFISYAKEDKDYAKALYNSLNKSENIEPWLDEKNLLPGMNWEQEIFEAISKSNYVIIILSQISVNKKGFIQKELRKAIDVFLEFPPDSIYIIPARVNECVPKYDELKKIQWVDLFDNWEEGINSIIKSIELS